MILHKKIRQRMYKFNLRSNVVAFGDTLTPSNPQRKAFDWMRSMQGLLINNPRSDAYVIAANTTQLLFDGTRLTAIDNTTEFSLTLSPLASNQYRLTYTGTGTAPNFRTDRALTLSGASITITVNPNATATLVAPSSSFTSVIVGDWLLVPGISTGDTPGVLNIANEGYWVVLAKNGSSSTLQLARLAGQPFSAYGQTIVLTSNTQIQAFSSAGLQLSDKVEISNGFSLPILQSYTIVAVAPTYFEFLSDAPLPVNQTGIPGALGIQFYTNAKKFLRIEADQESVIRLNGDLGNTQRLSPWLAGDPEQVAEYTKVGPVWSLIVVNRSTVDLNVNMISVE